MKYDVRAPVKLTVQLNLKSLPDNALNTKQPTIA